MPCAEMVYVEIKKKAKDAVLMMVEKEREGELIDRSLVKNILGIYIEVGRGCAGAVRGAPAAKPSALCGGHSPAASHGIYMVW